MPPLGLDSLDSVESAAASGVASAIGTALYPGLTPTGERVDESLARGITRKPGSGDEFSRLSQQSKAARPRRYVPEVPPSVVTFAPSFRSSRIQKHSPRSLEECANPAGPQARRPKNRREVNQVLKIYEKLASYHVDEEGQTMAEYGVVLAVITIAVFGALGLLSGNIVGAVNRVAAYIT